MNLKIFPSSLITCLFLFITLISSAGPAKADSSLFHPTQHQCGFNSVPLPLTEVSAFELIGSPRWASSPKGSIESCHSWVTTQSLNLALSDKKLFEIPFFDSKKNLLTEMVNEPDFSENNFFTFSGHFYDPDTQANWLGSISNTALTNFWWHTQESLDSYKNFEVSKAFAELGKAIHYLEDSCVPHHAANYVAYASWHLDFERYAQISQSSYSFTKLLYPFPAKTSLLDNPRAFEESIKNILIACAQHGKSYIGAVEDTVDASQANMYIESRCYTGSNSLGAPNCDEWDRTLKAVFKETTSRVAQYLSLMAYQFKKLNPQAKESETYESTPEPYYPYLLDDTTKQQGTYGETFINILYAIE